MLCTWVDFALWALLSPGREGSASRSPSSYPWLCEHCVCIVLTTVLLVCLVPAVICSIAVQLLRQALADIPTGEEAQGTLDLLRVPMGDCEGERRGSRTLMRKDHTKVRQKGFP